MTNLTVSQARDTLSNLLGKVQHGREDVIIQKHGTPIAVMIPVEAFPVSKHRRMRNWRSWRPLFNPTRRMIRKMWTLRDRFCAPRRRVTGPRSHGREGDQRRSVGD